MGEGYNDQSKVDALVVTCIMGTQHQLVMGDWEGIFIVGCSVRNTVLKGGSTLIWSKLDKEYSVCAIYILD